jgi:FtsZ-interacting cell division protein ZipA
MSLAVRARIPGGRGGKLALCFPVANPGIEIVGMDAIWIVLIVLAVILLVLLALFLLRRRRARETRAARVEAQARHAEAGRRLEAADAQQAEADRQAERARAAQQQAEQRAEAAREQRSAADEQRSAAEEQAARAREVDPDRDDDGGAGEARADGDEPGKPSEEQPGSRRAG